ncbi:ankyrin repeat domain-containing protein [Sodalis sp. RH19]|uniref:ankyrin repeat domain-containing protein n=1 Tax=Sodalis sp. RH19 TaxID=3394334 RepID=UPI0039B5ADFB
MHITDIVCQWRHYPSVSSLDDNSEELAKHLAYDELLHGSLQYYGKRYHYVCIINAIGSLRILADEIGFGKDYEEKIATFEKKIGESSYLCPGDKEYIYRHLNGYISSLVALAKVNPPQKIKDAVAQMMECLDGDVGTAITTIKYIYEQCALDSTDELTANINKEIFYATSQICHTLLINYISESDKESKASAETDPRLDEYYYILQKTEYGKYFPSPQFSYLDGSDSIKKDVSNLVSLLNKKLTISSIIQQLGAANAAEKKHEISPLRCFTNNIRYWCGMPIETEYQAPSKILPNIVGNNDNNFIMAELTEYFYLNGLFNKQIDISTLWENDKVYIKSFEDILWLEFKSDRSKQPVSLKTLIEHNFTGKLPDRHLIIAIKNTSDNIIVHHLDRAWINDNNIVFNQIENKKIYLAKKAFERKYELHLKMNYDNLALRLIYAIKHHDNETIHEFLQCENLTTEMCHHAMFAAIYCGATNAVIDLLTIIGNKFNFILFHGLPFLLHAASVDHPEILSAILSHEKKYKNYRTEDGASALMVAVSNNRLKNINFLLLDAGIDVNKKDKEGNTALMLAVRASNLEVIDSLLAHQPINIYLTNNEGESALSLAVRSGNFNIVKSVIGKTHKNELYRNDYTSLLNALNQSNEMIAKFVLENAPPPDINQKDSNGGTILSKAICGHFDFVKSLLERDDIDINIKDGFGRSALINHCINYIWANDISDSEYFEILDMLLKNVNLDINTQDHEGKTALHYAMTSYKYITKVRYYKTVESLLTHPNIRLDLKDNENHSALDIVKTENDQKVNTMIVMKRNISSPAVYNASM